MVSTSAFTATALVPSTTYVYALLSTLACVLLMPCIGLRDIDQCLEKDCFFFLMQGCGGRFYGFAWGIDLEAIAGIVFLIVFRSTCWDPSELRMGRLNLPGAHRVSGTMLLNYGIWV